MRTTVALVALLFAAAPALAQVNVSPQPAGGLLAPGATTELYVDVTVDCLWLAQNGGSATVTLATPNAPEWLLAGPAEASFNGITCLQGQQTTLAANITLPVDIAEDAIGLVSTPLTVEATGTPSTGSAVTASGDVPDGIMVDYRSGHTLSPAGSQTFDVTDGTYTFNLTIEVQANAKSMVMFENKKLSDPGAKLSGLKAVIFEVAEGEREATLEVTFEAPEGAWEEVTASFKNFSHCMGGPDCPPVEETNITYTFRNAGTPAGEEPEQDSPGFGVLALVGMLALAGAMRRR